MTSEEYCGIGRRVQATNNPIALGFTGLVRFTCMTEMCNTDLKPVDNPIHWVNDDICCHSSTQYNIDEKRIYDNPVSHTELV